MSENMAFNSTLKKWPILVPILNTFEMNVIFLGQDQHLKASLSFKQTSLPDQASGSMIRKIII
jgi:hypothetical protein